MDWIYIERVYKELQFEMDEAFEEWERSPWNENKYQIYLATKERFFAYCADILAGLMEENKDVLEELKNGSF